MIRIEHDVTPESLAVAAQLLKDAINPADSADRRSNQATTCEQVIVDPEIDLVARFDAELVSQLLGDDDLPLGTDTVSHTSEV